MAKHRNPVFRPLAKFSVYALACLVLLFVLAARVGNLTNPTHHRATYYAALSDAESLISKDDVKIAGVTVGQVHGVKVKQGKAIVKFSLDRNITLRSGTAAGMRFQNVIGAKYLYLYPSPEGDVVRPGGTLTHEVQGADVGNFLIDLGGFLRALNPNDVNAFTRSIVTALDGNQAKVTSLLDNAATVSKTLGGLDANIAHIVDNLTTVLSTLESRDGDLATVIDRLASVSANLATRNDVIDNVIVNFTTVNNDLSRLVDANRGNVGDLTANLKVIADTLQAHTGELDRGLRTASAGLAPYIEISKLGQWFAVRAVYACLANQRSCSYEQPSNQPQRLDNKPLQPGGSTSSADTPAATQSAPGQTGPGQTSSGQTSSGQSDPGGRPIGPPVSQPTVGNVIGFAVYGNGQQ
ncbi:MAG: hypothetical protein NVS3B12_04060 [Acidimicrobiales bacterium]